MIGDNTMAAHTAPPEDTASPVDSTPEPLRTLLLQATAERATDIHLDPVENGLVIRFRVDGIVHVKEIVPHEAGRRLQNQIRIAAELDTEALFVPVEARIGWSNGTEAVDMRVVIAPTGKGETTHLRLLQASEKARNLDSIGLSESDLGKVLAVLGVPSGLILVGGQTGTGKTTTLYAMASALDLETNIAVSIEDPVEFQLPGLRQIGVDDDHGMTIAKGLRLILRMDPDAILVGEIRDQQSAITAARAALAGRLVIASVHALDAAAAIEALHYLSVPYHVLGGCLRLVVAQNLVRRVCGACVEVRPLKREERDIFGEEGVAPPDTVPEVLGCETCHQYGYAGRMGVFETVVIDDALAKSISAGAQLEQVREAVRDGGTPSLLADALAKVAAGVTTVEEVLQFHWPARPPA
jgi:type IV pilus assembly protein PilB